VPYYAVLQNQAQQSRGGDTFLKSSAACGSSLNVFIRRFWPNSPSYPVCY
jgi:hypothetical protein